MKGKATCRCCNRLFRKTNSEPSINICCSQTCYNVAGPSLITTNTNNVEPKVVLPVIDPIRRKEIKRLRKRKAKHERFFKSGVWLDLRYKVLAKYGRQCMCCGETKGTMEVDHIIPRSKRPDLALKFDNLQVLCKRCNQGKLDHYTDDFRPPIPIAN